MLRLLGSRTLRTVLVSSRASSESIYGLPATRTEEGKPHRYFFKDKYEGETSDMRLAPGVFTSVVPPHHESADEFTERYAAFFAHPGIDGWLLRKGMNDMMAYDQVPEPPVIINAMHACRRMNEHSLAVRFLEAVQFKCGNRVEEWWPWIHQEIQPTLTELGISTPEEMGYDKPEFYFPDVDDM